MAAQDWIDKIIRPYTNWLTLGLSEIGWKQRDNQRADSYGYELLNNGQSPIDVQGILANEQYRNSPEFTEYLNNLIANQRTEEARAYDKEMSSSDLIRMATQLEQLGLNPGSVTDIGGSAYHAGNLVSDTSNENVASQRYAYQQQVARQMLGLVQSLAGAGIYGASYNAARTAAANIAGDTARTVQNMRNMAKTATHYAYQKDAHGDVTGYTKYVSDYEPYSW